MTATTLDPSRVPAGRAAHGCRIEDGQWKRGLSLAPAADATCVP